MPTLATISLSEFDNYWRLASLPIPIVVVGGGRWGRTWTKVIADARCSTQGIVIAARSDPESVRHWLANTPELRGVDVVSDLACLLHHTDVKAAIVASRPSSHHRDATVAISMGLHVLVEKPLCPRADEAVATADAARAAGRLLAIGTEFAFLPALHAVAATVETEPGRTEADLVWHDTAREVRHGAPKAYHRETSILADLLPHTVSIFHVLERRSALQLDSATLSDDGNAGRLIFRADENVYRLECARNARARTRILTLRNGARRSSLNFGGSTPRVTLDGTEPSVDVGSRNYPSTLRLELGAFLGEVAGKASSTPISLNVGEHIRLQRQLEQAFG